MMTNTARRPIAVAAAVATATTFAVGATWFAASRSDDHAGSGRTMMSSVERDAGGMRGMNRANGTNGMNGSGRMGTMSGMYVSDEFDYLAEMIPHHEEAITAARQLLAGTAREEMKSFARDIIRAQSAEVATMKSWLAQWYAGRDTSVDYRPMMRNLAGLTGDALDRAFLEDMIPHHHMAVMMSMQLVNRHLARHDDVTRLATSIRDTQTAEIRQMTDWLKSWFDVSGTPGMMGSGRMMGR